MEAKSLKNGYKIWLFDRGEGTLTEAKVVSVSIPHYDVNVGTPNALVVDVTVEVGSESRTYTMRDTAELCYSGNVTIAVGKESLLKEVEGVKQQAEQTICQVEHLKKLVANCTALLTELNPAERERAEMEKWKSGMEADVRDMKGMLTDLLKELKGGA